MKYIRTKDGIYEYSLCDKITINGINGLYIQHDLKGNFISLNEVLNQADTIEELCDEFVAWTDGYETPITCPLKEKERFERLKGLILLGINNKINCWLKLAIWTDKGLIYVAKMNDKGKLELL